jgi:hypothetical protein
MPNQESALRFIFSLIWPAAPPGPHKHALVERLTELRDTRHDFLTDDEYAQIRAEFLAELATDPRMPVIQVLIFMLFGAGGVAGIICGLVQQMPGAAGIGVVSLAASALIWRRMEQDYVAKRRLTRTDRLMAVDDLIAAELVSAEEAAALRTRIERHFDHERAA